MIRTGALPRAVCHLGSPSMKRLAVLAFALVAVACGSSSSSPAAPSTAPATQTRIINLNGALGFGTILVGARGTAAVTVTNTGNATLTITGLTGPNTDVFTASPTTGTVAPGGSLAITVFCAPKAQQVYSGTVTINGDQTSGVNTLPISCGGSLAGTPIYSVSGSGNNVFDIPAYVARIRITGTFTGFSSNFIVHIGTALVVNDLLGTGFGKSVSDGVYLITPGTVQITNSQGVAWTFTEVRQ